MTAKFNYNKSLDYMALAMNAQRKGQTVKAAKLFMAAATQDDTVMAIRTIEANNAAAVARVNAAKVEAAAKTEEKPQLTAAAKAALKLEASRRLLAGLEDDDIVEDMVDGTDDSDVDGLEEDEDEEVEVDAGDDFVGGEDDIDEEVDMEDSVEDEGDDNDEVDAEVEDLDEVDPAFARVLSSLSKGQTATPARKVQATADTKRRPARR